MIIYKAPGTQHNPPPRSLLQERKHAMANSRSRRFFQPDTTLICLTPTSAMSDIWSGSVPDSSLVPLTGCKLAVVATLKMVVARVRWCKKQLTALLHYSSGA